MVPQKSSTEGWHWPKLWFDLEMFVPDGCDKPGQKLQSSDMQKCDQAVQCVELM